MATFSIENFGCRATEADASALRGSLSARGLTQLKDPSTADVVVLNTCTVTTAADSQARDAVRKIHRANPAARIILTGCYAQRAPEELAALDGVSYVVGNSHQHAIAGLVEDLQPVAPFVAASGGQRSAQRDFVPLALLNDEPMSLSRGPAKILTGDIFEQTSIQNVTFDNAGVDRTRPILKLQDGCNNRCSYCVIPFVRGRSRSLPPDQAIAEIRKLVALGVQEVVLSGINLGSYGRDFSPRVELAALVRRILDETDLSQLRFSSIEPQDVTEDFVALVALSDRIAPHFHVPLQSGSDKILKAMHRWYRAAHYAERVGTVRSRLPHAGIGADLIVGFPGESDSDFQKTLDFVESLPVSYLHVFSFSPRPGTAAENLDNPVPTQLIRERARTLRTVAQRKSKEFRARLAGQKVRALTLSRRGDDWTEAITGNYLKVRIAGKIPANEWFEVEVPAEELQIVERADRLTV
jgi:threonylcarbamoyladenosine tRNA methylthiotransferase MtaB